MAGRGAPKGAQTGPKGDNRSGRGRRNPSSELIKDYGELTVMQRQFVDCYLLDPKLNAPRAAEEAGFNNAPQAANRLMKLPAVRAAIQKEMDKRAARVDLKADNVLQEIAKMAFCNIMDYLRIQEDGTPQVDLSGLDRDKGTAIQEVTVDTYTEGKGKDAREVKRVKFKLADKVRTLELLGKHLQLFQDKLEVTGKNGTPLVPQMSENEVARRIAFLLTKAQKEQA